jgi:trans-aconitate methyltransferase
VTVNVPKVTPAWLRLREAADAAARSDDLADLVRRHVLRQHAAGMPRVVVHDLGSGTGSMGRWLAPRLPGPQHWVMYDRDADLLAEAVGLGPAADGAPVSVEVREGDITRLTGDELDGATLITASALLDMFTAEELERVVDACHGAGCPSLLTLSVIGRVELHPHHELDDQIGAAFNAHQRRDAAGRRLLGPDAVTLAAEAFRRRGVEVEVRSSPWRLGPDQADLTAEWLRGWLDAAFEQRPDLAAPAAGYASRRLAAAAAGQLQVVVHHHDLLAGCEMNR